MIGPAREKVFFAPPRGIVIISPCWDEMLFLSIPIIIVE